MPGFKSNKPVWTHHKNDLGFIFYKNNETGYITYECPDCFRYKINVPMYF